MLRWLRFLRRRRPAEGVELVLYTRSECPLCDALKAELARLSIRPLLRVREVDIESDPRLLARYRHSVPVLALGGRPLCKGRLDPDRFTARLQRRLAEAGER